MRKMNFIPIVHLALASIKMFGRKRKMNKNDIFLTRRRRKGPLKVNVRLWLKLSKTAEILKEGSSRALHLGWT